MKILVLNGSPKGKGSNTYRLTEAFLEGICTAEEASGNPAPQTEILEVSKLNIKPCLGCFSCWNKTPGECCIHDDMSTVIEKFLWADVTVWSFPLYYFGLPGPLKNLIDRQLPMSLPFMAEGAESGGHPSRYDMTGHRNVLISTCGFYTAQGNYDGVTDMFDHFCGKDRYTTIFCGQGELFRVKELSKRTDEYLACVRKAGEEFASGGIGSETRAKLEELLYPREVFETMADASWGVSKDGTAEDTSLVFTKQMAALYSKESWPGHDLVIEMNYTDIGKKYHMILGRDGSSVSEDLTGECTTRINTPYSVWCSIASGEIAGDEAMMKHLYSVEGDFDIMLHWDRYFGGKEGTPPESAGGRERTNMLLLLLPWIVFWVAASINSFAGSLISIAVCVILPVLMRRVKDTLYDRLSVLGVGACSLALISGLPALWIIPGSYFLFGLMWCASCLTKIPLTAHYSKNDYNGDAAFSNPIFIKTNRILTLAWGILYLLTPIWTFYIMRTDIGSLVGAVNSVLPAIMGIFTAWFQKWYPAHVAKG